MDEKQNALKHFTMIVEIEERVGGAIYKASVHHDVLQHLLGERLCDYPVSLVFIS